MLSQPTAASSVPAHFSTDAYAPRERTAAWCDLFGSTIAKLEMEPLCEGELKADATLRKFTGFGLVTMTSAELRFSKTNRLIDNDDLILAVIDSGGWSGSQLGREAEILPGEAVVCTNSEIAVGKSFGRRTLLRVPAKALAPMVGDISAGVLRRIPAESAALRLLRPYIQMMQSNAVTPDLERISENHIYDLFALLLGSSREANEIARGRGVRAARLKAIKQDIAARLKDSGLSVADVARRHKLSPRYLHRLFEEDGVSFGEYLIGLRLTRAQRMLTDARFAALSISTVGHDVGFGDPSYFFRSFRRRFGMTPSAMRARSGYMN
jgi:AraC-like DNA-binding protein